MSFPEPPGSRQFACFRMLLGAFMLLWFLRSMPYAEEMLGRDGVLPHAWLNLSFRALPLSFRWLSAPGRPVLWLALGAALSALLSTGFFRRSCALVLWAVFVLTHLRNNLLVNVGAEYLGLMLLVCAVVPPGEPRLPWSRNPKAHGAPWEFPPRLFSALWLVATLGYTLSGLGKAESPLWREGTALHYILTGPLARDVPWTRLLGEQTALLVPATWLAMATETIALPALAWRQSRRAIWYALVAMHLGILALINLADLSLSVLLFHLLLKEGQTRSAAKPDPQQA